MTRNEDFDNLTIGQALNNADIPAAAAEAVLKKASSGDLTFGDVAALATGAVDDINEIDATLRSGADTTLITGTAGSSGNVPEFNSDGDIVDSGQTPGGGGGSISDSGNNNFDGGDVLNAPSAEDSLDMRQGEGRFEQYFVNYIEQSAVASDRRPINTTQPRSGRTGEPDKIHVDPGNGDDGLATRNVDSANPLNSFGEALSRIPHIVEHEFVIKLADGTYSGPVSLSMAPFHMTTWSAPGTIPSLRIEGNNTTPSNVVLDYPSGVNLSIFNAETDDGDVSVGGSPEEAMVSGVQFESYINNKGGLLSLANCVFAGTDSSSAILGKAGGKTQCYDVEFQSGLDSAVNISNIGAEAILRNCTGNVGGYVFDIADGAKAVYNSSNSVNGDRGLYTLGGDGGHFVWQDGTHASAGIQFYDDFGDDRLISDRLTTQQNHYRPTWERQNGTPDAVDGVMRLPVGNSTSQQAKFGDVSNIFSDWEFEFRFASTPTTGRFLGYCNGFGSPDRNGWHYEIDVANNKLHVDEWRSQTETADVITGSWTPDTDVHTMRLTNSDPPGDVEAFFDGTSIGTHSDSALDKQSNMLVVNETDAECFVDNVQVV